MNREVSRDCDLSTVRSGLRVADLQVPVVLYKQRETDEAYWLHVALVVCTFLFGAGYGFVRVFVFPSFRFAGKSTFVSLKSRRKHSFCLTF